MFKSKMELTKRWTSSRRQASLLAMGDSNDIDSKTRDLVVRLLTRAGMVMEDASAEAILSASADAPLDRIIPQLEDAAAAINSLILAAAALVFVEPSSRSGGPGNHNK